MYVKTFLKISFMQYNKTMNKQVIILVIGIGIFFGLKKLGKNVRYFVSGEEIHRKLNIKLKDQPWTLTHLDMIDLVGTYSNREKESLKNQWSQACEEKMDFNCRHLVNFKYASGKEDKALKEALEYCKTNNIDACIAATKMKDFNNKHPEFFAVTNQIITVCQDEMANLTDQQYWVCDYYNKK